MELNVPSGLFEQEVIAQNQQQQEMDMMQEQTTGAMQEAETQLQALMEQLTQAKSALSDAAMQIDLLQVRRYACLWQQPCPAWICIQCMSRQSSDCLHHLTSLEIFEHHGSEMLVCTPRQYWLVRAPELDEPGRQWKIISIAA